MLHVNKLWIHEYKKANVFKHAFASVPGKGTDEWLRHKKMCRLQKLGREWILKSVFSDSPLGKYIDVHNAHHMGSSFTEWF